MKSCSDDFIYYIRSLFYVNELLPYNFLLCRYLLRCRLAPPDLSLLNRDAIKCWRRKIVDLTSLKIAAAITSIPFRLRYCMKLSGSNDIYSGWLAGSTTKRRQGVGTHVRGPAQAKWAAIADHGCRNTLNCALVRGYFAFHIPRNYSSHLKSPKFSEFFGEFPNLKKWVTVPHSSIGTRACVQQCSKRQITTTTARWWPTERASTSHPHRRHLRHRCLYLQNCPSCRAANWKRAMVNPRAADWSLKTDHVLLSQSMCLTVSLHSTGESLLIQN